MNNNDRRKLERIYNCLKIPGCHCGASSQSMTVAGAAGYAADCTRAIPEVRRLIQIVALGEDYEGEFEKKISELETWFKNS
jgi:hypothetical protein